MPQLRIHMRQLKTPACHTWRRKWQPTPVFLPGKSRGQMSLVSYSPWGLEELDTTEQLSAHTHRADKYTHTHTHTHSSFYVFKFIPKETGLQIIWSMYSDDNSCWTLLSNHINCYWMLQSALNYNDSFWRRAPAELVAKNQGEMPTFNFAAMNVGAITLIFPFCFVWL